MQRTGGDSAVTPSVGYAHVQHNEYPPQTEPSGGTTQSDNGFSDVDLPPVDGGRAAIQFLVAAFCVEAVTWSQPVSYGVLLDAYLKPDNVLSQGDNAAFLLSLTGPAQSGIIYCTAPMQAAQGKLGRHTAHLKLLLYSGAVGLCSAVLLASFARVPYQVLLTQGILYGLSASVMFNGTFSLVAEWFVRRRGLASGVCYAGTSIGGIFLPYILTAMLSRYSWQTTLRCVAIASATLLALSLPFVKSRLPPSRRRVTSSSSLNGTKSMLKSSVLWLYAIATFMQGLGYFMTILYLPTFASSLQMTGVQGSSALAAVNGSAVVARLGMGMLADYTSPYTLAAISLISSGLAVFLLWGLASTSFAPLIVFSIAFGLSAGGFTSLGSGLAKDLAGNDLKQSHFVFGLISMTRGLGNVLTAPISSALLIYATSFSVVIVFIGVSLSASAVLSTVAGLVRRRRKKHA